MPAIVGVIVSVVLPILISLVGVIVDSLTGNAISGAILNVFLSPVLAVIHGIVPEFDLASITSLIPSRVWEISGYLGFTQALNMVGSAAVNIFTSVVSASMLMHVQSFLLRRTAGSGGSA